MLHQVGLNGVDNGAIRFTHVRVPREALLDRFATVDRSGRYSSPLPSAGKRFAATRGELTGGRVGLTAGSLGVLKVMHSSRRQSSSPSVPSYCHQGSVHNFVTQIEEIRRCSRSWSPSSSAVYSIHAHML